MPTDVQQISRRVLIVDDERDNADTLATLGRIWGHDVRVAYCAQEGIATAASFVPDVMIIDIGMPSMDGNRMAAVLREMGTEAVLVALSGFADADSRQLSAKAGFDHHLAKPADLETVQGILANPVRRIRKREVCRS